MYTDYALEVQLINKSRPFVSYGTKVPELGPGILQYLRANGSMRLMSPNICSIKLDTFTCGLPNRRARPDCVCCMTDLHSSYRVRTEEHVRLASGKKWGTLHCVRFGGVGNIHMYRY